YTIRMIMDGQHEEASTFEVQEFKAPRHFVEVDFNRATRKAEGYVNIEKTVDILTCTIHGKYYAGGPVKNGKVRWKVAYTGTNFTRKELSDYSFGNAAGAPQGIIESGETTLDEQGAAVVSLPIARDVAAGLYGVEMTASVIDFDGKVSTQSANYQEEPAYLVGISPHRTTLERGDSQALRLVVLSKKGSRIQEGKLNADIMRRDYTYVLKRNDKGNAYWEQNEVYVKEASIPLKIVRGSAAFDFDFTREGSFQVRITYKTRDGKSYVSSAQFDVDYGAYRYYDNDENIKFERLSVQTDKTTYARGETIRVYVGARKKLSSLLMTIEREGIIEHEVVTLKPNRKYIDIPVKESFGPNVYISFFGITARGEFPLHSTTFDAAAPDFAFGTTKVSIRRKPGTLTIAVNPDEKQLAAEPGTSVTLNISAKDHEGKGVETEMTVAVVDESVLALTRFQTPSLDSLGSFSVPLGVLTGELRAELLKQTPYGFLKNRKLTGGDGGGGEDVEGKLRRDFRPVAYYNAMVRTGADGTAQVSFTLPDSMTTYRVYVVACDRKDRFASFQRPLVAKRDFYVEPGTPRFFTKGDRFIFFVSAFNKTDGAGEMRFTIKSDQRLALSADSTAMLSAQDRLLVPVKGEALQAGLSNVRFSGAFMNKKDSVELKLPVKAGYIRWNDILYGTTQGDSIIKYEFPSKDAAWAVIDPNEVDAILTLSSSPFFRLSQGIKYLLAYPYGCVEQTSSRVIPLAALRGLIKDGFIPEITVDDTEKFLRPGIERLLSMQVGSGGYAYWPGQREASQWGTVYAVTALTRARMAGVDVPQARLESALAYLVKIVKEGDKRASNENAFALYLLALNGKLDKGLFTDVYKNFDKMSRQGGLLVMLAAQASGHLSADEISARTRALLGKTSSGDYDDYYAVYREPAIALMAANSILKDDALSGKLAKGLLDGVNSEGRWGSTSDTGWALLALGEYFRGKAFSTKPVEVTIEQPGRAPEKTTVSPSSPFTRKLDSTAFLSSSTVKVSASQGTDIAYSLSTTLPRVDWAGKGASNGLKVAKRIENIEGGPVIRVGDIVKVTVAVQSQGPNNYIAVDDPLPAGFVAINTAIKTEEQVSRKRSVDSDGDESGEGDEVGEVSEGQEEGNPAVSSDQDFDVWGNAYPFYPNHFELRDDRVLAFRDRIWGGVYEYSYYARAVCEGEFVMPQTKAQLMYKPDVVGYTPMSTVTIKPRK
ncbi:MAG TPA: alpha-2-macroglobulin family protein, partial [Dissulfurispiraceae bacterium]|nr:alpha-2-macroglobulin family protein [Dissulfurispiraceae bacterium]